MKEAKQYELSAPWARAQVVQQSPEDSQDFAGMPGMPWMDVRIIVPEMSQTEREGSLVEVSGYLSASVDLRRLSADIDTLLQETVNAFFLTATKFPQTPKDNPSPTGSP